MRVERPDMGLRVDRNGSPLVNQAVHTLVEIFVLVLSCRDGEHIGPFKYLADYGDAEISGAHHSGYFVRIIQRDSQRYIAEGEGMVAVYEKGFPGPWA